MNRLLASPQSTRHRNEHGPPRSTAANALISVSQAGRHRVFQEDHEDSTPEPGHIRNDRPRGTFGGTLGGPVVKAETFGFRADFFDILNVADYTKPDTNIPDTNIQDTNFGVVTNVRNQERRIQLSLNYKF